MTAAQEPRAGEVLTAESVKLLRAGDVLRVVEAGSYLLGRGLVDGGLAVVRSTDGPYIDVYGPSERSDNRPSRFAFVSRPSEPHPCYGEHQPGCDCAIPAQTAQPTPSYLERLSRPSESSASVGEIEVDGERVRLPGISLDGPHRPCEHRVWLARQLLDSQLSDEEAYSTVAFSPAIDDLRTQAPAREGEGALIDQMRTVLQKTRAWMSPMTPASLHAEILNVMSSALSRQHQEGEGHE